MSGIDNGALAERKHLRRPGAPHKRRESYAYLVGHRCDGLHRLRSGTIRKRECRRFGELLERLAGDLTCNNGAVDLHDRLHDGDGTGCDGFGDLEHAPRLHRILGSRL